jgi:two-component system sensor histidine kinase/response regulator
MRYANNKRIPLFASLVFCLVAILATPGRGHSTAKQTPIAIGVLAVRGPEQCLNRWSPTAEYLTRHIDGHRFTIVPLSHDQIYAHVKEEKVEFVLANSAFYVGLEHWYQANRIATLKVKRQSGVYATYGGVIFGRSDRKDIRTLNDLKGKTFMGVSEFSLGGWLAALREFKESGIDPQKDFKALQFGGIHDRVVYAVRDGLVDAGTVRTDTLEKLSAEGKINLDDFYVFPGRHQTDQEAPGEMPPYSCTTREYPAWPMAKVRPTSNDLAEKVAVALLKMPPDSPAAIAADCAGWTIPLNYQPVHACLKALKAGPYTHVGEFSITDVLHRYGYLVIFTCTAFCVMAGFIMAILKLNRRIKSSHLRLKTEIDRHKQKDRQLKQAKELAETATRAKSEFLANMSHEIRTPMNGIQAATDLALSEDDPLKIRHYLKIIQSSTSSLLGIINDLLDFSKIEAGKFELKERMFRLNEVFDRVMDTFGSRASNKGIELLVQLDPNTPKSLFGDPLRLQQILTNLVSNAVKFTESGGFILIRVRSHPKNGGETIDGVVLDFSVKDTGCGIAPEYIDLLFEPFSQADTSSTRRYEGTGLGLSICKQLVTLMDGDIEVESQLGSGSTFSFFVHMRLPKSPQEESGPIMPPDIQGLNVLVVDDLRDSRVVMRSMLESMSFRVQTLGSGMEALQRLKDNPFRNNPIELIMMDWKMPEMDGIEVSKKIREELKLKMPIIMMTAFGKERQRIEAEKAGINGFLTKPIYPSTLFDAIMDGFGKEGLKGAERRKHFTTKASIYRKPLKGKQVLVAEDNLTNQQVAQAILEKAGIHVTVVSNGEAAVNAVKNNPIDAVLMDIQMPGMNGYEATRRIRRLNQGTSIPIIAMTAHAMKGDEEKCLEAGMDGYISKPVNQDRLFLTLWRLLRSENGTQENAESKDKESFAQLLTEEEEVCEEDLIIASRKEVESDDPLPEKLPGIQIARAMEALKIDGFTYKRIVSGFGLDNLKTTEKLKQAFVHSDLEQLLHFAHRLKGSAANIGATELHQASHQLENACRNRPLAEIEQKNLETLVENVTVTLNRVLLSIQQLEETNVDEMAVYPAEGPDRPFEIFLDQMIEAIDRADPEQITQILPQFKKQATESDRIDPLSLQTLQDQIARYDYDQALESLRKIKTKKQENP